MSQTTEKFALALKKEPQKTFRKLGLTNGDDVLTDDGVKIFLTWMLQKYEKEFYEMVAEPMLKEQETQKA